METLFITKDAKIEREDGTLIVKTADGPKRRFPVETIRHIVISGESGLTSAVLGLCGRNGIRVTFLDWYGNVSGCFEPLDKPAAASVRMAQSRMAADTSTRLPIAIQIVESAAMNIMANLKYRAYRGNRDLEGAIQSIEKAIPRLKQASDIEQLMGYEGNIRAWYYEAWKFIHPDLDFGPRRRRPPNNPVNCLISWFNSLAYTLTRNEISKTHLDDCISFLHAPRTARHSLALDLSEPFKPIIVDTIIFEVFMRGTETANWFHQEDGVCRLSDIGKKATLELWSNKVDVAPSNGTSFRDSIRECALSMERHLLGIGRFELHIRKV